MVNARERIHQYQKDGLTVERFFDEPGRETEPHAHYRTVLYGIAGSLTLFLEDQDPVELTSGVEAVVAEGQTHHAVVGPDGCKYIAAYNPDERAAFLAAQAIQPGA